MWLKASLIAIVMAGGASVLQSQPISVPRERVLGSYGTVKVTSILVTPAVDGPGIVFIQPVRHDGASSIRLRFTVKNGAAESDWTVKILGTDGRIWEHRPETARESVFWSDEMPGDHATIQLIATTIRPTVQLVVDRTAGTTQPTVPKAITEPDEREPWAIQQEPIRTLGRSVLRLRFVDDERKRVFVCTGWLAFTNRYVLTNEHCINSEPEALSALADLDFDEATVLPHSVRFRQVLLSDPALDFALLELEQPIDRPALSIGTHATANENLVIIEHPAGEPKQVSRRGCTVALTQVPGTTIELTDFEHRCDTLGGSSGSPVIDAMTFKVIGLHHLGFVSGEKPVNRAVQIDQVVGAIRRHLPEVVASEAAQ